MRSTGNEPAAPDRQGSLDDWVVQLRPALLRFIRYLSRGTLPEEDLCQDVLLRALQAGDRPTTPEETTAWLFRIARNRVIDEVRASRRRSRWLLAVDAVFGRTAPDAPDPSPTPRRKLGRTETAMVLSAALEKLDESSIEMISLRFFAGMSTSEIAEALSVPVGTVCAKVFRASGKLRRILEEQGYSFSDLHYED